MGKEPTKRELIEAAAKRATEKQPDQIQLIAAPATVEQLFGIALARTPIGRRKKVSASSIITEFEQAWADGIRWRKSRGISVTEAVSVLFSRFGQDARYLRPDRIQFIAAADGKPETDLKDAFSKLFDRHQSVGKAYLVHVIYDESPERSVALCLSSASPKDADLVSGIRKAFAALFGKAEHMDILFLSGSEVSRVERVCQPFYLRQTN